MNDTVALAIFALWVGGNLYFGFAKGRVWARPMRVIDRREHPWNFRVGLGFYCFLALMMLIAFCKWMAS